MSGLALVHDPTGRDVDVKRLGLLLDGLAWRGRDHRGLWHGPYIGLGAVQFWTTPEDWGSTQPVVGRAGRTALVLDGRVDNRRDLERDLRHVVAGSPALSDAELALAAYHRWGPAFVERLVGPFSVAVWDAARSRLVCGRDAVGQRPFYYCVHHGRLWAASSIQALRTRLGLAATLNEDYLWDFLCTGGIVGSFDPAATPFREIRRLPAGHVLVATAGGLQVERYWRPWAVPPLAPRDEGNDAEQFREIFTDVVRAHGRAPGPLAATLSGGLDSSSIVCVARELERSGWLVGEPLHTLTLVWQEATGPREGYDERRFVEAVVGRHPGPAHDVRGDAVGGLDFFSDTAAPRDEPMPYFGQLLSLLAGQTRLLGSRVLLSGDGGDHLMTGNDFYLADLLRLGQLGQLASELRGHARRRGLSYPALVACYLIAPRLPRHLGGRLTQTLRREPRGVDSFYYWHVPNWVRDPDRQRTRGAERHRLLPRRFTSLAAQKDYERLGVGSTDHVRVYLHSLALAAGVDVRAPFLDRRLADFSLRLPPQRKARDGTTKLVLRQGLADVLPAEVAHRRDKTGYDFAFVSQVRRHWTRIQEVFSQSAAHEHGFLDAAVFLEELAQVRQGGGGSVRYPSVIAALGLEDWLRSLDHHAPSQSEVARPPETPRERR